MTDQTDRNQKEQILKQKKETDVAVKRIQFSSIPKQIRYFGYIFVGMMIIIMIIMAIRPLL